ERRLGVGSEDRLEVIEPRRMELHAGRGEAALLELDAAALPDRLHQRRVVLVLLDRAGARLAQRRRMPLGHRVQLLRDRRDALIELLAAWPIALETLAELGDRVCGLLAGGGAVGMSGELGEERVTKARLCGIDGRSLGGGIGLLAVR